MPEYAPQPGLPRPARLTPASRVTRACLVMMRRRRRAPLLARLPGLAEVSPLAFANRQPGELVPVCPLGSPETGRSGPKGSSRRAKRPGDEGLPQAGWVPGSSGFRPRSAGPTLASTVSKGCAGRVPATPGKSRP